MADDLMRMQRQAALRVQQMQDHSRRVFETYQGRPPEPLGDAPWQEELHSPGLYARQPSAPVPHKAPEPLPEPPTPHGTVSLPRLETEQWLLLGLTVLLWRCGCRIELILALLYLAL